MKFSATHRFAAPFAVIALAALTGHRWLGAACNWRPLRLIGVTGFSWYLIHFPILRLVNALFGFPPNTGGNIEWTLREPLALATSFVITSAAAVLLYLTIEKPFMMLSRNLIRRPKAVAA